MQSQNYILTKFIENDCNNFWVMPYQRNYKWGKKEIDELVTFFEFPYEIRTLITTINPIENFNLNIRKISKNKSFPNMKSLLKVIYYKKIVLIILKEM